MASYCDTLSSQQIIRIKSTIGNMESISRSLGPLPPVAAATTLNHQQQ